MRLPSRPPKAQGEAGWVWGRRSHPQSGQVDVVQAAGGGRRVAHGLLAGGSGVPLPSAGRSRSGSVTPRPPSPPLPHRGVPGWTPPRLPSENGEGDGGGGPAADGRTDGRTDGTRRPRCPQRDSPARLALRRRGVVASPRVDKNVTRRAAPRPLAAPTPARRRRTVPHTAARGTSLGGEEQVGGGRGPARVRRRVGCLFPGGSVSPRKACPSPSPPLSCAQAADPATPPFCLRGPRGGIQPPEY